MNGQYEQKFPQARALYLYMAVHPGKKLNLMGNEIGQLREWDEKRRQDWELRKYPAHDSFYRYISELNCLYLTHPAFYECDYEMDGFSWLDCRQEEKCVYAMERRSKGEELTAVFNFSDKEQEYTVSRHGIPKLLIYSDWERFGGKTPKEVGPVCVERNTLRMTLAPFSGILIEVKR